MNLQEYHKEVLVTYSENGLVRVYDFSIKSLLDFTKTLSSKEIRTKEIFSIKLFLSNKNESLEYWMLSSDVKIIKKTLKEKQHILPYEIREMTIELINKRKQI
jgi:hypothetical protein